MYPLELVAWVFPQFPCQPAKHGHFVGRIHQADGLVYGCGSVSNGIAEGWGSKAAVPGTDFSQDANRRFDPVAGFPCN